MKIVKFVKLHMMYQRGETAGFDDLEADRLIKAGVAVDPEAIAAAEAARADAQEMADQNPAAEKAKAEKEAADRAAAEKAKADKGAADRAAAEKAKADQEEADRASAEKAKADQEAADKIKSDAETAAKAKSASSEKKG